MTKPKLIGEVTPEQIEEWKKKYGPGKRIVVCGHVCYLRYPTRVEVAFLNSSTSNNGVKSNEVFLTTIWLGGSEEIKTNDRLFFAATKHLTAMITDKEAELEDF